MTESTTVQDGYRAACHTVDAPGEVDGDDEIFRIQADGFGETEGGFQDVERIWRQRQQQN